MSKKIPAIHAHSDLEKAALAWLNRRAADYDDGWKGAARDLFHSGCSSGVVSELIYNNDCDKFTRKHLVDILQLWEELWEEMGELPLPRKKDGMNLDTTWLAWMGFEEAARRVTSRAGYDD